MPQRIQLKRAKGWRKPADAVVVRRPTRWGNPYPVQVYGRAEALRLFEQDLLALAPEVLASLLAPLRGKDVACVCRLDEACHGDIWLCYANA
jgi:hypothetical protein